MRLVPINEFKLNLSPRPRLTIDQLSEITNILNEHGYHKVMTTNNDIMSVNELRADMEHDLEDAKETHFFALDEALGEVIDKIDVEKVMIKELQGNCYKAFEHLGTVFIVKVL